LTAAWGSPITSKCSLEKNFTVLALDDFCQPVLGKYPDFSVLPDDVHRILTGDITLGISNISTRNPKTLGAIFNFFEKQLNSFTLKNQRKKLEIDVKSPFLINPH